MSDQQPKLFTPDELRSRPVRVTGMSEIFIGDEQILAGYPIADGGITCSPIAHHRLNKLTIELVVGPVSMEVRDSGPSQMPSD